jgi:hypothetical protein
VPGIDGEEVPAETIVPDAKEYISETIDDPEAIYDPEISDTSGFALVLSWLAQKWNQRCRKLDGSRMDSWPSPTPSLALRKAPNCSAYMKNAVG